MTHLSRCQRLCLGTCLPQIHQQHHLCCQRRQSWEFHPRHRKEGSHCLQNRAHKILKGLELAGAWRTAGVPLQLAARLPDDPSSDRRRLLATNTHVSVKNVCKYAVDVGVVANPQQTGGGISGATPGAPGNGNQPSFKAARLEPGSETAVDFAPIDATSSSGVSLLAIAFDNGNEQCMIWGFKTTLAIYNVAANCNRASFTYEINDEATDYWTTYMDNGNTTCGCYYWLSWVFIAPFLDKERFYITVDCDGLLPLSAGNYDGFLEGQAGSSSPTNAAALPASTTVLHLRNNNTYPVKVFVATGPTWSAQGSDACLGKEETPPGCVLYLEAGQDSGPAISLVDTTLVSLLAVGGPDSAPVKVWGMPTTPSALTDHYCGINFIPDSENHEPYTYLSLGDTLLGCYQYFTVDLSLASAAGAGQYTLILNECSDGSACYDTAVAEGAGPPAAAAEGSTAPGLSLTTLLN